MNVSYLALLNGYFLLTITNPNTMSAKPERIFKYFPVLSGLTAIKNAPKAIRKVAQLFLFEGFI